MDEFHRVLVKADVFLIIGVQLSISYVVFPRGIRRHLFFQC